MILSYTFLVLSNQNIYKNRQILLQLIQLNRNIITTLPDTLHEWHILLLLGITFVLLITNLHGHIQILLDLLYNHANSSPAPQTCSMLYLDYNLNITCPIAAAAIAGNLQSPIVVPSEHGSFLIAGYSQNNFWVAGDIQNNYRVTCPYALVTRIFQRTTCACCNLVG